MEGGADVRWLGKRARVPFSVACFAYSTRFTLKGHRTSCLGGKLGRHPPRYEALGPEACLGELIIYPSQPELDHPTVSQTVHSVVFLTSQSTYHTRHRKLPLPVPSQDTPGGNPLLPVPSLVWTVYSLLWTELCCPPNSCVEVLKRWSYLERVVTDVMSPDEVIRVARIQCDWCPSTRGTCGQKHWHREGMWRRSSTS